MGQSRTHFLLVGDSADIPTIQATLRRLPVDAYGQVILEVASPLQFQLIDAPEGVAISWLFRDSGGGILEPVPARGERIVRALEGWLAEWMPEHHAQSDPLVLWIGCCDSALVDEFYLTLRTEYPQLHLHLHHPHDGHVTEHASEDRR